MPVVNEGRNPCSRVMTRWQGPNWAPNGWHGSLGGLLAQCIKLMVLDQPVNVSGWAVTPNALENFWLPRRVHSVGPTHFI
mgnify:CR=1 FL=1